MLALFGACPSAPGSKDCKAALVQQQLLLTPRLAVLQAVFCSSKLIDALITFGHRNYLEFNLLQGRQASYLAARLNAAVIACFSAFHMHDKAGLQLDQASAALPLLGLRQGHCCKQSAVPGRVFLPASVQH